MTTQRESDADLEVVDLAAQVEDREGRQKLGPPSSAAGPPRPWIVRVARSRWTWASVVILLIAWGALAAYAAVGLREDAARAQSLLGSGRDAIVEGRLSEAASDFGDAADLLRTVPDRAQGPTLWPAQLVPSYRRTLLTIAGLGRAGALVAGAAEDVAVTLSSPDGASLVPQGSQLPVDGVQRLSDVLADAAAAVEDAADIARRTPTFGVVPEAADAHAEFVRMVEPTGDSLRLAADVTAILPALFGADGPRQYLVLASNPTENRGTGGFIGAVSTVTADDGRLAFGPVLETQELPIPPEGTVEWGDPSLEARWDRYGGASRLRSINMTPDFPAAARTIESYWAEVFDEELDGVISVDPFALQALLSISGPLDVPGFGQVTAEEVVEFVSHDAYAFVEDPAARKRLVGDLTARALQAVIGGDGDIDPGGVLQALGAMVARDSLLIHSTRPEEQAVLVRSGIAGDLTADGGDLLAVVLNSGSGSKIDYFLERTVRYDVQLRADGAATSTVTAGLRNGAPTSGELTYMIGPPDPDVAFGAGDNVSLVSVYCGPGCRFIETPDDGYADLTTEQSVELGFPVASTWVLVPSMRAQQLIYSYDAPAAWERLPDGDQLYRLRYEHQTAIRPTALDLRVRVPEGSRVAALPDGAEVVDGHVVLRREVITDLTLEVRFTTS